MVHVASAVDVQLRAKNGLGPGLNSAARDLNKFSKMMSKATPIFAAQKMLERQAALLRRGAQLAAGYVGAREIAQSVTRFADVDRQMRRAAITGDAVEGRIGSATAEVRDIAMKTAQPIQRVQEGLDSLTASGMDFETAMKSLPTVAKVAQATGAEVRDIATTTSAATDNFGIAARDLEQTYDLLAKGGKLGKFELKDMARYLPSILPAAKAVGMAGNEGMARLVAMLQTIRIGTGSAEEAAASAQNIFAKMESEQTAKNFLKFGVDLRKEMEKARKEGKDLTEVFVGLTERALKGDLSKIPQLFQDMEFARGMRALLDNKNKLAEFIAAMKQAGGTIDADFNRVAGDTKAKVDQLSESFDRATAAAGGLIATVTAPFIQKLSANLQRDAGHLEKANEIAKKSGTTAAMAYLTGMDGAPPEAPAVANERRRYAEAEAEAKRFRLHPSHYPLVQATHRRFVRAVADDQLARSDIKPIHPGETVGEFARMRAQSAVEAARYKRFEETRAAAPRGRGLVDSGMPVPPVRPVDLLHGGPVIPVQPLEEVKAKAEEVKAKVVEIGPAGAQAGSQLATGLAAGLAAMEAQVSASVDRMQSKLNTLHAPRMSVGLGGLDTGRSMNEVR